MTVEQIEISGQTKRSLTEEVIKAHRTLGHYIQDFDLIITVQF